MKRFFIIIFIFSVLLSDSIYAQTYVAQVKVTGKKWGYITNKGELIIPPIYEDCYPFSDNLGIVKDPADKNISYFLNIKGEKIIPEPSKFVLHEIFGYGLDLILFEDGLIPYKNIEKKFDMKYGNHEVWTYGYLNTSGRIVIPAKYVQVTVFNDGFAIGKTEIKPVDGKPEAKYYIIDTKGKEIPLKVNVPESVTYMMNVPPFYFKHFSEGLASFKTTDDKMGYIDTMGNVAIQPKFESVGYFIGGLAWARTSDDKVGYIDHSGSWVIKPIFSEAKDFDPACGMARIEIAKKWAYTDKFGKILNVDTEVFGDFNDGLAKGRKKDKIGFFNSKGEWIIQPQFESARDFKNGYAAVKQGGKWGVIDTQGKWVINPTYEAIKDMELVN